VLSGRKKVYYGWWLLAGAVVAMALGSGVSFWSFGLYVGPLEDDFGWSRGQVSLGFSLALLVSGLSGPFVGRWVDMRGPRSAILIGGGLTAASYMLLASTNTLWQWYLYSAINAVFRQMMFFIPFQTLVSRWFERRRGTALSILSTGFSLGGFIVVPLMGLSIDALEWRGSFVVSGAAVAAVFLPIGLFLIKDSPAEVGALVDGAAPEPGGRPPAAMGGATLRAALRTPLFWMLAAALMMFFFGMFGWMVHQIPFYESQGMSRRTAATIVSLAAGAGIFARLGFGLVSDKVRRFEYAAMTLGGFLLAAMLTLLFDSGPVGITAFLVFWIIGTGGGPVMEAMLLTRAFGVARFATILGAVVVVETAGLIVSPTIAGVIFDRTGSYDWALAMFAASFALAMGLFAIAARMPRPEFAVMEQPGAGSGRLVADERRPAGEATRALPGDAGGD
jgi:sugar phosphate permease